ncbi:uncharacterized protein MYCFIDRAFT_213848 [Pseudocercospora fijiensis CIRAD86]|uniref:Uncharacterized protein n=1 Tax=Pseudocercospora fijiensis (strain CIRAD86) TaxID=383855 RepID=M3B7V4_PSEFD|nr:uncharacterized protein MYCFIDRAFT_213848 [Pseudocercospora fijiensis CIRAD86]EME85402.1 hypothetical protein MYCFIDRAFT_213848 [Pseudocercospora fijiensis CIRAD86]
MKPFKPPSLVNRPAQVPSPPLGGPPAKRRRISKQGDEEDGVESTIAAAKILSTAPSTKPLLPSQKFQPPAIRKPLTPLPNASSQPATQPEDALQTYYLVLWRKFTTKKNKTWDGDGVLSVSGKSGVLQDICGKELGRGVVRGPLLSGSELSIGGKEVEVDNILPREEYISGRVFLGTKKSTPAPSLKEIDKTNRVSQKAQAKHKKLAESQKERLTTAIASTQSTKSTFKTPLLHNTVESTSKTSKIPEPRHDPKGENALVMKRLASVPKGRQIVDVVVDPLLTKHLREHQREGVAFLYECVMGMKDYDGEGAILADEMGLGKTLQTIALLWTLLKQNPVFEDAPVIKKALIVCPVSLIKNWRNEFRKWLGSERIGVFVADDNKMRLTDFTKGRAYHVMIIGYEKLTKVKDQLQGGTGIDIVICDEGHRLKTASNKAAGAIKSLNTDRRIILSGTPIQNDLSEFYTMVDFVNPNIMSKYTTFKKEFETPILKSRQPGASQSDLEKGEARSAQLADLTGKFILRRTAEILNKYLPPKTEYVVFCRPTEAQKTVYRMIVSSQAFMAAMNTKAVVLELIMILKKVCNSPNLLIQKTGDKDEQTKRSDLFEDVPKHLLGSAGSSGKLQVFDSLLHQIHTHTDEKVVVVSNYTSTMDVLGRLLTSMDMSFLRLDGSTPTNKRQEIVDHFNRWPRKKAFVLLLSAKAGGVGLNLIGASRLVMFDMDWNPATDLQAMARVHRDGQKRPCFIYRLLTQGALDEKIFQRQVSKVGLADSIVDGKAAASGFTQAELRDLFTLDEGEDCQTHKLLGCSCGGNGQPVADVSESEVDSEQTFTELDENGVEVWRMDGDSDDDHAFLAQKKKQKIPTLAEVDRDAQEAEIERNAKESRDSAGRAKMLSLMQYTHFDTALAHHKPNVAPMMSGEDDDEEFDTSNNDSSVSEVVESAVQDDALRSVICEPGGRVGFVFAKLSS